MSYFTKLRKITFLDQTIVNLATVTKLHKLVDDKVFNFYNYHIEGDERPDHVAFNYYDSSRYAWLVLLANNILDPYWGWPISGKEYYDFLRKKYGSVATATATIIHCEHNSKDITVSADSLADNMTGNGDTSSYSAVNANQYWTDIMQNRRHIKLIGKEHLGRVESQFRRQV